MEVVIAHFKCSKCHFKLVFFFLCYINFASIFKKLSCCSPAASGPGKMRGASATMMSIRAVLVHS